MTEQAPEAPQDQSAAQPQDPQGDDKPAAPTEDATDWKAEARKWEQRAKDNQKAARELEQQRQASMTEAERAVAEAEARGRAAAASDFGQRLARTEFAAAAARRNADFDAARALEFVDLARFVGDDGEPDAKAITAAVERLVPEPSNRPPSFDGGARTPAPLGADMNAVLRRATGRG